MRPLLMAVSIRGFTCNAVVRMQPDEAFSSQFVKPRQTVMKSPRIMGMLFVTVTVRFFDYDDDDEHEETSARSAIRQS